MREFEYLFDQGLMHGVRTSRRNRVRGQQLIEAYNLCAGRDGLEPYQSLEIKYLWDKLQLGYAAYSPVTDGRHPLIFNGSNYSYMVTRDDELTTIYSIDDNAKLDRIDFLDIGPSYTSIADFGEYCVLTGERSIIQVDRVTPTTLDHPGNTTMPWVGACCNFRGQFIGGNVKSDWDGCGEHSVVFSEIGSIVMNISESNIAGNVFVPTTHKIIAVRPLLDHVIVYTTGDIWALTPVVDPAPTFKLTRLGTTGIMNALAVGGDTNAHLMVDYAGAVWMLGNDLKPARLGYEEYFEDYVDDVAVVFDASANEWRINCDGGNYLFADNGLTSCFQLVTGILSTPSQYVGVGMEDTDLSARVVTDSIDFGYRAIKTIHNIELGVDRSARSMVAVDRRFSNREQFNRSMYHRVNSLGHMSVPYAGTDFRIAVEFDQYQDALLDYFKLRYKMSDMRGLRGVYAPAPRGQYAG